ncbi:TadE family type IV pilus minor pilin [Streptomyces fructofermentans]|uniref:TadE-like protein n=1 Tax=Streptomyces fructofermentans TaxID=152141 RepID=A0A918KJP9_9ACTN|nr:hypothetical protein GCM10010515_35950 [Streptomyces fructofermentans]
MGSSETGSGPRRVRAPEPPRGGGHGPPPAGDRGFVTAEAAVALPVLVAFSMVLVWALTAAAALIQCVDAARAGARAAARQDPPAVVSAAARATAPDGARITVRRDGDLVRVRVEARTPGPDALTLDLVEEATALAEETVGAGG